MKLLNEFVNFRSVSKLFQLIGARYSNFFLPKHVLLKGCFSFKTKDLVFDFDKIFHMYENNYPIPNNRGVRK